MRRILLVLGVALVMAAMLVSTGVPALADKPTADGPCTTQNGKEGTRYIHTSEHGVNFSSCRQNH